MSLKRDYAAAADDALVGWSQQGDTEAFEQLVFRHRDKIYARAMLMMRNEEEALDLSQEAWVKAWQRLHQFQGDSSFATWMTRIVINLCLDQIRRQKKTRSESIEQLEEDAGGVERQMPVEVINPTEGLEKTELRRRIDEAMSKLTEAHRVVLVMHEFEGLQYKEIADRIGISIGTVMSRLFYARRRLASLLQGLRRERTE
ncbi:MAG: sigma-70 family RNA polymerase sigma factor [Verrucomicrobiales bacterium]|nr:sigma-70 family RNA polymerase sigma factor [Verrucomicrobiales bacterium]